MNIQEFLVKTHGMTVRPKVQCVDGFAMSIQASRNHYCTPRDDSGSYSEIEIGFPSSADDSLTDYAEDADNPTGTVYAYVPVDVAQQVIDKHGGIAPTLTMMTVMLR